MIDVKVCFRMCVCPLSLVANQSKMYVVVRKTASDRKHLTDLFGLDLFKKVYVSN